MMNNVAQFTDMGGDENACTQHIVRIKNECWRQLNQIGSITDAACHMVLNNILI